MLHHRLSPCGDLLVLRALVDCHLNHHKMQQNGQPEAEAILRQMLLAAKKKAKGQEYKPEAAAGAG